MTLEDRMKELMVLIDGSIALTDDKHELIMLACAMLKRSVQLLDTTIGESNRKTMVWEWNQ
jgi:hypothetical protein